MVRVLTLAVACWLGADLVSPTVGGAFALSNPQLFVAGAISRELDHGAPAQIGPVFESLDSVEPVARADVRLAAGRTLSRPSVERAFRRRPGSLARDSAAAPSPSEDH